MFKIEFKTSNAAFDPEEGGGDEIRRILESVSDQIAYGFTSGRVVDLNGNAVGSWEWSA